MILSQLIPFLKNLDARPKKWLSQNFLIEPTIVQKIITTAEIGPNDCVLEIGPGPGALTEALLKTGATVHAVEIDPLFARELNRFQNGKLFVYEENFLEFEERLPPNLKIVANLPYHITTPILEKIFSKPFSSITVMVQKEVADRMIAKEGCKDFGSLSLFVQFHSKAKSSFTVPPNCFYPRPSVDSTVVRLDFQSPPKVDKNQFFSFVHKAFQQRRKMITSSLPFPKELIREYLLSLSIRPDARPEDLSLNSWADLTKKLSNFLLETEKEASLQLI